MARIQIVKKNESQELQLYLVWKQLSNETVGYKNITLKNLWEFRCDFCEAEHGVKCGITTGVKSKPWVLIAVVLDDFYQRWNRTANYARTTFKIFSIYFALSAYCITLLTTF